jgi:DNA repair exonuclease SbcCD nuclease subunit
MRLLLLADLHLDAPFVWAGRDVASRRRLELRRAFTRYLELAERVDADALLIAGDLFEHDRLTPDTASFLLGALHRTDRPVFIAPGNHDWYGPDSLYARGDLPRHVHVFAGSALEPVELEDGITLWGAAHRAPANTDGFLSNGFRVDRGGVHLALFHGSESSGGWWEVEGKAPHAPFEAGDIEAAGLHHACCGHYHVPKDERTFTYPGNPEVLSFGEQGERGAVELRVLPDGAVEKSWHRIGAASFHDLTVDVGGSGCMQDVLDRVSASTAGLAGYARVTLAGEVEPTLELDLDLLAREKQGLEAMVVRGSGVRVAYCLERIALEQTVRGQFVRDVRDDPELTPEERSRVLVTGLRALDGRRDLEFL